MHAAAWKALGVVHIVAGAAALAIQIIDHCTFATTLVVGLDACVFIAAGLLAGAMTRHRNACVATATAIFSSLSACGGVDLIYFGLRAVADRSRDLPPPESTTQNSQHQQQQHDCHRVSCPNDDDATRMIVGIVLQLLVGFVESLNAVGSLVLYCRSPGSRADEYEELDGENGDGIIDETDDVAIRYAHVM